MLMSSIVSCTKDGVFTSHKTGSLGYLHNMGFLVHLHSTGLSEHALLHTVLCTILRIMCLISILTLARGAGPLHLRWAVSQSQPP